MRHEFEDEMKDFAASQDDPRILAVIEEMLERIRTILDLFEGIIHEVWHVAQIVMDMIEEIRELFRFNRNNKKRSAVVGFDEGDENYIPVS
ncbi:MAG: hypothetical protein ACXWDO_08035 [Bacteroidia bacterium]